MRVLFLLVLVSFCAAFAADPSGSFDRRPVLRWMGHWKGEGAREQFVRFICDEFSYLHPEIDVNLEFAKDVLPSKTQWAAADYIVEMIRSGKIDRDVIWLDQLIYKKVAEQLQDADWGAKYLVDFREVPGFQETQNSIFASGRGGRFYPGGLLPGPYLEGFLYTAWYNKQLAAQLGIEISETGMSEVDLLGYVKKVNEYNRTAARPISVFLDVENSGSMMRLFCGLLSSSMILRDDNTFADQDYVRVESFFDELGRDILFGKMPPFKRWNEAAAYMVEENRALFFMDATWRYTAFDHACPGRMERLGLAQMPGFEGRNVKMGGFMTTWAVMKQSPAREAGIKLLQYMSRPVIAQKWVHEMRCPTGLKGCVYGAGFGAHEYAAFQRELRDASPWLDPLIYFNSSAQKEDSFDMVRVTESVMQLREAQER